MVESGRDMAEAPRTDAEFAAAVEAAWAEGPAGWERLGVPDPTAMPSGKQAGAAKAKRARRWWDSAPWYGQIADEEFRAIVAAYVARYGSYTPDLPLARPALLRAWRRRAARDPKAGPPVVAA